VIQESPVRCGRRGRSVTEINFISSQLHALEFSGGASSTTLLHYISAADSMGLSSFKF